MLSMPSESNSFVSKVCLNITEVYICTCSFSIFPTRHTKLSSFLLPLQGKEGATVSQSSAEAREKAGHSHREPWERPRIWTHLPWLESWLHTYCGILSSSVWALVCSSGSCWWHYLFCWVSVRTGHNRVKVERGGIWWAGVSSALNGASGRPVLGRRVSPLQRVQMLWGRLPTRFNAKRDVKNLWSVFMKKRFHSG